MDKHTHTTETGHTHPNMHAGVYGAIAGSLILSLLGTYLIVQNQQVEQVGGRENYKMYQKMVQNPKYGDNIKQSLEAQIKQMEGGSDDTAPDAKEPTADTGASAVTLDTIKSLFVDGNIHIGSADSKLLLVEISDPSCPYCHAAAGTNPELSKQMGSQFVLKADGGSYLAPGIEMRKLVESGKASFVFLYSNGHGSGELATQALFCAQEKGKFWAVNDKLMTMEGYNAINNDIKNDKANSGKLADFLAKEIDPKFMKDCLESEKYVPALAANQALAAKLGSRGTPGFFVNTTNFSGAVSFANMQSAVTAALK